MTGRTIIGKSGIARYSSLKMPDPSHPDDVADRRAIAIARHLLAREGTGLAWGVEIEVVRVGYARIAMLLRSDMLNGYGSAHGGMLFALADTAFAYACNSRNLKTVAQHGSITFLDGSKAGERLTAEAREVALRGRTGVYAITIKGDDYRTLAEMQGISRTVGGAVLEEEPS